MQRRPRRLPLPAQRQSRARPEVRLQAPLVRAPDRACRRAAGRPAPPVVLAGDYNVMPTDLDIYKPERWVDDALFRPEVRDAFHRLVAQGWTDALRALHPDERDLHLLGLLPERVGAERRPAHRPPAAQPAARRRASSPPASTARCAAGRRRATTRRPGSSLLVRAGSRVHGRQKAAKTCFRQPLR